MKTSIALMLVALFLGGAFFLLGGSQQPAPPAIVKTTADFSDLSKRFASIGPDPGLLALAKAARKYGVDPVFFQALSKFETGGEFSPIVAPKCKNCTAQGMCQMIAATRRAYKVKKARYVRYKSGPKISWMILTAIEQADACARLTRHNMGRIRKLVDRKPAFGELYLVHLLGWPTARRVILAKGSKSTRRIVSKGAWRNNKFIRRAKTIADLRRAASVMIRNHMKDISVPDEQSCRTGIGGLF